MPNDREKSAPSNAHPATWVAKGEPYPKWTKVLKDGDGKPYAVTKSGTTKHKALDATVGHVTTFDFSNCTPEQILEIAARDCIITFRREILQPEKDADNVKRFATQTVDVAKLYAESARRTLTPAERLKELVGKVDVSQLSDAEREELIQKLSK